jgi:hypothetical protein
MGKVAAGGHRAGEGWGWGAKVDSMHARNVGFCTGIIEAALASVADTFVLRELLLNCKELQKQGVDGTHAGWWGRRGVGVVSEEGLSGLLSF